MGVLVRLLQGPATTRYKQALTKVSPYIYVCVGHGMLRGSKLSYHDCPDQWRPPRMNNTTDTRLCDGLVGGRI